MWITRLVLFVLISVESLVLGQNDYYSMAEKRQGSKYCGRNLADALRLVCGGLYNSMFPKKSDPDADWYRETDVLDPNDEIEYMFRPRSHAKSLVPQGSFRRHTRRPGAYDECCLKSCTVSEMMGYCAEKP